MSDPVRCLDGETIKLRLKQKRHIFKNECTSEKAASSTMPVKFDVSHLGLANLGKMSTFTLSETDYV